MIMVIIKELCELLCCEIGYYVVVFQTKHTFAQEEVVIIHTFGTQISLSFLVRDDRGTMVEIEASEMFRCATEIIDSNLLSWIGRKSSQQSRLYCNISLENKRRVRLLNSSTSLVR